MMPITELQQAIYRAINGWRVWVTLLFLALLILNEAVLGIREGQTIVEALTRISYLRMLQLAFVCGVIAQAGHRRRAIHHRSSHDDDRFRPASSPGMAGGGP